MPEPTPRTPIATAPLSVVLTAWNNAADLDDVLRGWRAALETLKRPFEIVLVDDGSTDATLAQASAIAQDHPWLRLVLSEAHSGVGVALRRGIEAATHPLVVTAPADKQFSPADLPRLLETIDQVDIVTGYRVWRPVPRWLRLSDGLKRFMCRLLLGSAPDPRDCWLGWSGWRRRFLARWIFGVRVQDPECPFRLYRREIFQRIPLQSRGSAVQLEILAKANHLERIMAEAPVSWLPPHGSADPVEQECAGDLGRLFAAPAFVAPSSTSTSSV